MKNLTFYFLIISFLYIQGQSVFGQTPVQPTDLNKFWSGIKAAWIPAKDNDIWTEEQRNAVLQYCKKFAECNSPKNLLPSMVEDIARRPSEVNAFIYTWVVLGWNKEEVKMILAPFYEGNDSLKKQIASDFIASIEEAKELEKAKNVEVRQE